MARALEIVGERWSLLIVRDAFFGVCRFSDFASHLDIPRAILTERLTFLVGEGILARGPGRRSVYTLTDKGTALWPVVRALTEWGDAYCAPHGPRRAFEHAGCGGQVSSDSRCSHCAAVVPVEDTLMAPGPGFEPPAAQDLVGTALSARRRLLTPIIDPSTPPPSNDRDSTAPSGQ